MAPHCKYTPAASYLHRKHKMKSPTEVITDWFSSIGLYRKFIARNESCIFRAVADTRYLTQSYYLFVQRDLLEFTQNASPEQFMTFSNQKEVDKNTYLESLRNPLHYRPSLIDLFLLSMMYGYNFKVFYQPDTPPLEIVNCAARETILLYTDSNKIFDLLYTEERYQRLAWCQHFVYELYYKDVFKLEDVNYAVHKMLSHDASPTRLVPGYAGMDAQGYIPNLSVDKEVMPLNVVYAKRFELRAKCANMRHLLEVGITPFPYKVAKALHPDIYRNIEFDVWVEGKRGSRTGLEIWSNSKLVQGVTCVVCRPDNEPNECIIQEVNTANDEAKVFVIKDKGQGHMMTVPMQWLKPMVQNQVLVAQRRYLRGSWAEATADTLAHKRSTHSDTQDDEKVPGKEHGTSVIARIRVLSRGKVRKSKPEMDRAVDTSVEDKDMMSSVMQPKPALHNDNAMVVYEPESDHQNPSAMDQRCRMDPPDTAGTTPHDQHSSGQFYPGPSQDWQEGSVTYSVFPSYDNQGGDYSYDNVPPSVYNYNETPPPGYNYSEAPSPGYVHMYNASPLALSSHEVSHNTSPVTLYSLQQPPNFLPSDGYNCSNNYSPPDTYNPVFSPEIAFTASPSLHTTPTMFYTELPTSSVLFPQENAMFSFYPEQRQTLFPFTTMDFTIPPPEHTGLFPHDVVFIADRFLAEVDPYLVPPPSYGFCPTTPLSPPNTPDLPYYYPVIHQAV